MGWVWFFIVRVRQLEELQHTVCVRVSKTPSLHPLLDTDEDAVATVTLRIQEGIWTSLFPKLDTNSEASHRPAPGCRVFSLQSERVSGGKLTGHPRGMETEPGWTGGASRMLKAFLYVCQSCRSCFSQFSALLSHTVVTACPPPLWGWAGWEGAAASAHRPFSSSHSVSCH